MLEESYGLEAVISVRHILRYTNFQHVYDFVQQECCTCVTAIHGDLTEHHVHLASYRRYPPRS